MDWRITFNPQFAPTQGGILEGQSTHTHNYRDSGLAEQPELVPSSSGLEGSVLACPPMNNPTVHSGRLVLGLLGLPCLIAAVPQAKRAPVTLVPNTQYMQTHY